MKISSILLLTSLSAVSAFGLPFHASSNAVKTYRGAQGVPAKAALMRDGLVSPSLVVSIYYYYLVSRVGRVELPMHAMAGFMDAMRWLAGHYFHRWAGQLTTSNGKGGVSGRDDDDVR